MNESLMKTYKLDLLMNEFLKKSYNFKLYGKRDDYINKELMMSLMVDGVKKDGNFNYLLNQQKDPEKESVIEEAKQEAERNKVTVREKSRDKRNAETDYKVPF